MPRIEWQWKRFAALSAAELYAALAARASVFVVEQACAYLPGALDYSKPSSMLFIRRLPARRLPSTHGLMIAPMLLPGGSLNR